jgi:hypothetical protein
MKTRMCVVTALMMLFAGSSASAQQLATEAAQIRKGERMIRAGVGLMAAGALVIPATSVVSDRLHLGPVTAGAGLMMAGGLLTSLGIRERQRAVRPELTFGMALSHSSKVVQFRRSW